MRLVVDTGVFSATLYRRRQPMFDEPVRRLQGHQIFLAAVTVAELRYGAIIAERGAPRRRRIETAIAETTVVPVTDALIVAVAELRAACRQVGHPLADRIHSTISGSPQARGTLLPHS